MNLPSLESIASRINREHQAALQNAGGAIEHARVAGKLLLEARARCETKKWQSWLTQNCSEIADRTARKYMEVARHPELEASSIKDALLRLSSPRQQPNKRPTLGRSQADDAEGVYSEVEEDERGTEETSFEGDPEAIPKLLKLLQVEQLKVARLRGRVKELEAENNDLSERLAAFEKQAAA